MRLIAFALLLGVAFAAGPQAGAQTSVAPPVSSGAGPENTLGPDSDADIWRQIRQGAQGTVSLPDKSAGILIQSEGEVWRSWRNGPLSTYGAWLLLGVVAVAAAYFAVRGRIKIRSGRSGRVIPRFSLVQRIAHWFTAILFVLLGVSGLLLLYGKYVLIPIIGAQAFGVVASAAMQGHNLFGPLFIPALVALVITFVRGNGYRLVDFVWAAKGGGFLGGHASSYRYNFGEKSWFWWSVVFGTVLCVSGIALSFPWAMPGREALQFANLFHAGAALLFIAFGLGHIYLGTIGMEGALEGMTRGVVDENWAKEHHDLWHAEHVDAATTNRREAEVKAAAGKV